jgi:hypothetical protein
MPQHRCGRLRLGILIQVVLCLAPPGSRPDARCDAPAINCSESLRHQADGFTEGPHRVTKPPLSCDNATRNCFIRIAQPSLSHERTSGQHHALPDGHGIFGFGSGGLLRLALVTQLDRSAAQAALHDAGLRPAGHRCLSSLGCLGPGSLRHEQGQSGDEGQDLGQRVQRDRAGRRWIAEAEQGPAGEERQHSRPGRVTRSLHRRPRGVPRTE